MADRKKKPFTKKPNIGKPFDKSGKLADAIRAISGKKMPFDKAAKMQDGGKVISDADKALMRRMKPKLKRSEMNEITALEMQRSLNPYSDADRELLRRQPTRKPKKMKKGGEVCRGAGGVDGGNRGAQFRGVR